MSKGVTAIRDVVLAMVAEGKDADECRRVSKIQIRCRLRPEDAHDETCTSAAFSSKVDLDFPVKQGGALRKLTLADICVDVYSSKPPSSGGT